MNSDKQMHSYKSAFICVYLRFCFSWILRLFSNFTIIIAYFFNSTTQQKLLFNKADKKGATGIKKNEVIQTSESSYLVKVYVTVFVTPPATATTLISYIPFGVLKAIIIKVDAKLRLPELGMNIQDAPGGRFAHDRVTFCDGPEISFADTLVLANIPVPDEGLSDME